MRFVAAAYNPVTMAQVVEAVSNGARLPPRAIAVTFDDAYADFAENAWPVMQRHGIPATLFVPTAHPGRPDRAFWWDRIHAAIERSAPRRALLTPIGRLPVETENQRRRATSRLLDFIKSLDHDQGMAVVDALCQDTGEVAVTNHVMRWELLRRLASEGVALCAHTQTHPLLTRISADQALREVQGSLRDLREEIGGGWPAFAYPAGAMSNRVKAVLSQAGIVAAFTTVGGVNAVGVTDPLSFSRINVGQKTTVAVLRAKLIMGALAVDRPRWRFKRSEHGHAAVGGLLPSRPGGPAATYHESAGETSNVR
jgi:peptidoglycan/xylan/chitin deacetylase (PgdA/CDA1 family)